MLFRKDSTLRERATVALANLERNAYAMGMLRSRIESRAEFILKSKGDSDDYKELARVLELVKNGELVLSELSGKMEAARFLEEFVVIINGAADSVNLIKSDFEHLVPLAENALAEMQDAITRISSCGLYTPDPEPGQIEVQDHILAEATALATSSAPSSSANATLPLQQQAVVSAIKVKAPAPEQQKAEVELA